MNNSNSAFAAEWDTHIAQLQAERRSVKTVRDGQVEALYPHARTFVLKVADPVDSCGDVSEVPATLTMVTPDHADPSRDEFYVGALPVLSRNLKWTRQFEELDFTVSDGARALRGHLRLTHSRLRAFGIVSIGTKSYAVEYEVPPQRYTMRVAPNAAYLAGDDAAITWDTQSGRWKDAAWTAAPVVEFTYGINGEEVIGDEEVYTFLGWFKDVASGREWQPEALSYDGFVTKDLKLGFRVGAGTKVPAGPGAEYFPYVMVAKLSEFAYDFEGGMVIGAAGYTGTPYGVIGTWARRPAAGMYVLQGEAGSALVSVHDGVMYVGVDRVSGSALVGDRLTWAGLEPDRAEAAGIPSEGYLVFSADASRVTASSFGMNGERMSPDEALKRVDLDASFAPELRTSLVHSRHLYSEPGHGLSDLLRMTQYQVDAQDRYYDVVQKESMDDFYTILQNYMDQDMRRQFFSPAPPPPLDQELSAIAHVTGTKGTDPIPWYGSLSTAYTACALSQFSSDPAAEIINGRRAEEWLTQTTSGSDVMAAQSPLLYQRRYQKKYDNLSWFLADQKTNAVKYEAVIDAKVEEWVADARADGIGTPDELKKLEDQMRALGKYAKDRRQYWAFAVYTYTTTPAYLNMLRTIVLTGNAYDGSEFSQRVQRTVAILNVLDTNSYISQQYAYLLQAFQLGSILPQLFDFGTDLGGFNFAVKQIVDQFIETYLHSPDPKMREAAEQLRQNANQKLIDEVLKILHASAAVGHGIYEWIHVASRFETRFGRAFAHIPSVVGKFIALAGGGAMLGFFLLGAADFTQLSAGEQALVVAGGLNTAAQLIVPIIQRGLALGAVWDPSVRWWSNLRKFFSPKLMDEALTKAMSTTRTWLMSNKGGAVIGQRIPIRQAFAARSLFTATSGLPFGQRFKLAVLGRNMGQFVARLLGSTFAIIGIVLTSIALSQEQEPLELAANILFLIASSLELVAIVGGWAVAGSAVAVGGMLVSTIFAIVSVVGVIALVAGIILLVIFMKQPQETPVEKFAKASGTFYMPNKTAIEYFQVYQPTGLPQRAGVAVLAAGNADQALNIGSDGAARVAPFDATGHTAFYITTDETGRVQIGAPILDDKKVPVLFALAVDDTGTVMAKSASGKDASLDTHLLWYTEVVGEGTYEQSSGGRRELRAAPFKLYTAHEDGTQRRYLDTDGSGGWKLRVGDGAVLTLKMETVKPAELTMANITWYTTEHNLRADAALQVPGSEPRRWTIDPALPEGLEFLPAEGAIQMRTGVDVTAADRKKYTLTCSNDVGTATTDFILEVLVPVYTDATV